MGCPVVASAIGAHLETVLDGVTGLLVPPTDVAAWSRAIDAALAPPEEMRRAGRERAITLYSLDAMVAEMFDVYRQSLS